MKPNLLKLIRLMATGIAGIVLSQSLQAAELLNGGFNSTAEWTSPGTLKAGNEGGDGWSTSYFGGTFPTNNTFAAGVNGPVRQDLSGAGNTFLEGVTYKISMSIFGSSSYKTDANVIWSLGFAADGDLLAGDHWFSEEFSASTVGAGNGGTIPDDHINTLASGNTGLRTVSFSYTATAADAGKVIGVQIGGDDPSPYVLAAGAPAPDDWYGMMDDVTFEIVGAPKITGFTSDIEIIDGIPFHLSWQITDTEFLTSLTLDDGSGPVDVLGDTDEFGEGGKEVNPTENTTYTLTANGLFIDELTVYNGKINSFTNSSGIAVGPDYETLLTWDVTSVEPATVTISDGINTFDVSADTIGGYGSKVLTVPSASTIFTLDLNAGSAAEDLRVLRAVPADPDLFWLGANTFYQGDTPSVSWKDAANASGSWVGIYKPGDVPGPQLATRWTYITNSGGANGTFNVDGLAPGEYYAVLFVDDEYIIEQGPVTFTVSSEPPPPPFVRAGDTSIITWDSQPGATYNLFGSPDLAAWTLIQGNIPSGGIRTTATEDLGTLPGGVPANRFYRVAE